MRVLNGEPLRHDPDFVRLWVGQSVSQIGSQVGAGALGLVAILVLHANAAQVGLMGSASGVAALASSLLAGPLVDRARRRPLLIASDLGRFVLLASVGAAAVLGGLNFAVLLVVAALVAALSSLFDVAYPSYLPSLVGRERLVEGNSRLSASNSFAEIAGQPVGGGLVQFFGAPIAVLIDAVSFLASVVSLGLIRKSEPLPNAPESGLNAFSSVVGGTRFLFRHDLLRPLTVGMIVWNLGGGVIGSLYALYGLRTLGLTPFTLGVTIGVGGVLSLVGAGLVERANRAVGVGAALAWAGVIEAAFAWLIPLAGGPLAWPMMIAAQIGDVFGAISMINQSSLQQSLVPDGWLGRVNSSAQFLTRMAGALGAVLGGAVGELFGLRAAMILGVLTVFLANLWIARSPIGVLRQLPEVQ